MISALGSKNRWNQKNKGTLYHYVIGGFYFGSPHTLLFWFDLFLEARAEIFRKLGLGEIWRRQKDITKLTDLHKLPLKKKFQIARIQRTFSR